MNRPSQFALLGTVALATLISLVTGYVAGVHRNRTQPIRSVHVRGTLGRDLGQPMTIEGILVDGSRHADKGDMGKTLLEVSTLDRAPTLAQRPIELKFAIGERPDLPPPGSRIACYGFESGAFIGVPATSLSSMPEVQVPTFHLQTHFEVLKWDLAKESAK